MSSSTSITAIGRTGSSSWADETDDFDEQQRKTTSSSKPAWSTGNPLTGAAPASAGSQNRDDDYPPAERRAEDAPRRDRDDYPRRDNRDNRDYNRRDDYPRRDNNDRYQERRQFDGPRRDRDDYPRRNDFGDRRNDDRPRRDDYPRRDQPREPREPRERVPIPFPEEPPYTAFVGNIPFTADEDQLADFLGPDVKINQIRFTRDHQGRPKGFGYVEFDDAESLRTALKLDGETFNERQLKVDIAGGPQKREGDRDRRDDRRGDRRDHRQWNDAPRGDREPRNDDDAPRERRRVELQPRSNTAPAEKDTPSEAYKAKANPFGDAKPSTKTIEVEAQISKKLEDTHISRSERRDDRPPRTENRDNRENRDSKDATRPGYGRGGRSGERSDKPREENAAPRTWERGQGRPAGRGDSRGNERSGNRETRGERKERRNPAWEHDDREAPKPRRETKPQEVSGPTSVKSANVFDALPDDDE